jgi:hypothetical protein
VHGELKPSQQIIGLGGAAVGVAAGLWGAVRPNTRPAKPAVTGQPAP